MFDVKALHIAMEIWGCIFCLIAAICIFFSSINQKKRKLLIYMQLATSMLLLMDTFAWAYRGYPGTVGYYMVRISNCLVFLLSDVILLLFHAYVCSYIFKQESHEKKPIRVNVAAWVCIAGIIMVIISQFTDLYYYFDADNIYHRNTFYPLSVAVAIITMAIDCSLLIQYHRRLNNLILISLFSYIVFPAISSVMLLFYYGISLGNIAVAMSMIVMFVMAIVEQSKLLREKERELYDLKIDVMISQIKPHFIYNTLTAIKYMCRTNPQQAEETLDEFAGYLRGNVDALTLKENIPFERELEHVKSYLAIEKKRFGERVNVAYNIKVSDFLLPPITLQPIVENAVKHGITKKLEGGTIRISTEDVGEEYVVRVEDNGVGFSSDCNGDKDSRKHVGISNVRSRIESMRDGKLNVYSVPGKGTTVELRLPKNAKKSTIKNS